MITISSNEVSHSNMNHSIAKPVYYACSDQPTYLHNLFRTVTYRPEDLNFLLFEQGLFMPSLLCLADGACAVLTGHVQFAGA